MMNTRAEQSSRDTGVVSMSAASRTPCDRMALIQRQHEQLGRMVRKQQALLAATRKIVCSNAGV